VIIMYTLDVVPSLLAREATVGWEYPLFFADVTNGSQSPFSRLALLIFIAIKSSMYVRQFRAIL